MPRVSCNHGFSLLELIIAAIIAVLGVAGFFAALGSSRKPIPTNDKELKAALAGKAFLEDLRTRIAADTYQSTNPNDALSVTTGGAPHKVVAGIYNFVYDVDLSIPTDDFSPKKVSLNVEWD